MTLAGKCAHSNFRDRSRLHAAGARARLAGYCRLGMGECFSARNRLQRAADRHMRLASELHAEQGRHRMQTRQTRASILTRLVLLDLLLTDAQSVRKLDLR